MEPEEIKQMWEIDQKAQLGDKITDNEKDFFNKNYEKMRELMHDNYCHWQFHSGQI